MSPIYPSPLCDAGYDVKDYLSIDPRLGTMENFHQLVTFLKDNGCGLLMDLVLNHTSTEHRWFKEHPEYYCWASADRKDWKNLFDEGSAWHYHEGQGEYYLSMFHPRQADLNYFPDGPNGDLNEPLIKEFRQIVDFWMERGVAGFRLDAAQVINKDIRKDSFDPLETCTLYKSMAAKVIQAIFGEGEQKKAYLLMECLDMDGSMVGYYSQYVNAVMNNLPINLIEPTSGQQAERGCLAKFLEEVRRGVEKHPDSFAHVTESHDGQRAPSLFGVDGPTAIQALFGVYEGQRFFTPCVIVMYQGQELGLCNPAETELSNELMLALDAKTTMLHGRGAPLSELRSKSRANSRVPVPMEEYAHQEAAKGSCLWVAIDCLIKWRRLTHWWTNDWPAPYVRAFLYPKFERLILFQLRDI